MNWKLRFKNKATLTALVGVFILFIKQITEMFGIDISNQLEQASGAIGTLITILAMLGVITDPTTTGLSDSGIVQTYSKPRKDTDNPVEFSNIGQEYKDVEEGTAKAHDELDEDEAPYKNEAKPYGVEWGEEVEDKNVQEVHVDEN